METLTQLPNYLISIYIAGFIITFVIGAMVVINMMTTEPERKGLRVLWIILSIGVIITASTWPIVYIVGLIVIPMIYVR